MDSIFAAGGLNFSKVGKSSVGGWWFTHTCLANDRFLGRGRVGLQVEFKQNKRVGGETYNIVFHDVYQQFIAVFVTTATGDYGQGRKIKSLRGVTHCKPPPKARPYPPAFPM